jgi:hypothetical protein
MQQYSDEIKADFEIAQCLLFLFLLNIEHRQEWMSGIVTSSLDFWILAYIELEHELVSLPMIPYLLFL